jgi:hypothetical protein
LAYTVTNVLNVSPSPSGGSAGQILYQSAANTTANTDVGTAGYLLTSQGTGKPTWSAQSALVIANTQITGVITAAQHANTAVTPGTYGGAAAIPVIIVDQQGRLTSAANVAVTTGSTANVQTFNATGTWTKPSGVSMAKIQIWGGGGGSGRAASGGGGGGGGAYNEITVPISYLGATVTATVGTGGTAGTSQNVTGGVGGSSSFVLATAYNSISTLIAYGGGGGIGTASGGAGGGGGGSLGAGAAGATVGNSPKGGEGGSGVFKSSSTTNVCNATYGDGFDGGGGGSGDDRNTTSVVGHQSVFGGGGGGGAQSNAGGSVYGGGGGAGTGAAGASLYGGAGGAAGSAGTAPGGGGGATNAAGGAGAAGRIIVYCW